MALLGLVVGKQDLENPSLSGELSSKKDLSMSYGYSYFGDPEDDEILGETELETLKNIALEAKDLFNFKLGTTKTGGDIRAGVFPGAFGTGKDSGVKTGVGFKVDFSTAADSDTGPMFTRSIIRPSPTVPRMPQGATVDGYGRVRFGSRRFQPSPYIPRMPGQRSSAVQRGFRSMMTQSKGKGPVILPDPMPPSTGGPPKPINIPDIPIPPDPPKDGFGRAALPPVRMGMRTMIPSGPPPGSTIFDPREEMIQAARMGPTPFGPGATIYRPDMPMVKDPPDKFLSGYGAFENVGKMGFAGKAAVGIGLGVMLVGILNLGAKR